MRLTEYHTKIIDLVVENNLQIKNLLQSHFVFTVSKLQALLYSSLFPKQFIIVSHIVHLLSTRAGPISGNCDGEGASGLNGSEKRREGNGRGYLCLYKRNVCC
jgi:hypothetical protein